MARTISNGHSLREFLGMKYLFPCFLFFIVLFTSSTQSKRILTGATIGEKGATLNHHTLSQSFPFPSNELTALYNLYNATHGESWQWKNNETYGAIWNFNQATPNPCTELWQGIICTSDCLSSECFVQSLVLVGYDLRGILPPSISDLNHLITLELSQNPSLTGFFPSSLTVITTLQTIDLSSNSLFGPLPSSLDNLINLQSFDTSENFFTSSIPHGITSLINLQSIKLNKNLLTGELPTELGNLKRLTTLNVADNILTGQLTSSFCDMISLEYLYLNRNRLGGQMPYCLDRLINIQVFSISVNIFYGAFPQNISTWRKATTFEIQENTFEGLFPPGIGYLTNLTLLNVSGNHFRGELPLSFKNLTRLQEIDLSINFFKGSLSIITESLLKLTKLQLQFNGFEGTIPSSIANLQELEYLDVTQNFLYGSIPSEIGELKKLKYLYLTSNKLDGSIPTTMGQLIALTDVDMGSNSLDGSLPGSLLCLGSLEYLVLDHNALSLTLPDIVPSSNQPFVSSLRLLSLGENFVPGTIPPSWGQLRNLTYLSLSENRLAGEIPKELGQLTNLVELNLFQNFLEGKIPFELQDLTNLTSLTLAVNFLNGSIPDMWYNFKSLRYLDMKDNFLSGSLPPSLSYLSQLIELYVSANVLKGSLPDGLFHNFTEIQTVEFSDNFLTGPLPSSMYYAETLAVFRAAGNILTGTLVDQFEALTMLNEFSVGRNLLRGFLPMSLSLCSILETLDLNNNEFEGNIPSQYYSGLLRMKSFDISNNLLQGNISSSEITKWKSLQDFELENNFFTGSVPSSIFVTTTIKSVYLEENFFYGYWEVDESTSLASITILTDINLNGNMLSGTIPTNLNQIVHLASLNISHNFFTGTLPQSVFSLLTNLESVDISKNQFSGNLENIFTSAIRLHLLFAENNRLSGQFQNIFDISTQTYLIYVDLSDNIISGSLSAEFFITQNLSSIALVKNCMTGSIPDEICTNRFMEAIALDGLHTAEACQTKIFPWFRSYVLRDAIRGSIPPCLFDMDKLITLHLSGNNIQGKLSDQIVHVSPSLNDLSLSHNLLTGTIPIVIQNHTWLNLDLSFNKFNGKLAPSIRSFDNSNQSLSLDVNRLSGGIPSSLFNAFDVDMLRGNLFGCNLGHRSHQLPKNDQEYNSYQCGSNNINVPLYIWTFVLGTSVLVFLLRRQFAASSNAEIQRFWKNLQTWWAVFGTQGTKGTGGRALNTFGEDLALLRRLCTSWTALVVIILIPLYSFFSIYYTTHEYTYAWFISLAYTSGRKPAGIAFAVLMVVLLWVEYNIEYIYNEFLRGKQTGLSAEQERRAKKHTSFRLTNSTAAATIQNGGKKEIPLVRTSRRSYFSQRHGFNLEKLSLPEDEEDENETGDEEHADHKQTLSAPSSHNSLFQEDSGSSLSDITIEGHNTIVTEGTHGSMNSLPKDSLFQDIRGTFAAATRPFLTNLLSPMKKTNETSSADDRKRANNIERARQINMLKWKWILISMGLVVANLVIVLSINAAYVYAVTTALNPILIGAVTVGVTFFKIAWSIFVVAGYFCYVFDLTLDFVLKDLRNKARQAVFNRINASSSPGDIISEQQRRDRLMMLDRERENYIRSQSRCDKVVSRVLIWLSLFNAVIAPLLAVLLVSSECFYYVIQRPASVSVSYRFLQCEYGFVETPDGFYDCAGKSIGTHTASYSPAFNYSYQCTSSLLANFVNVYLYRYLISGILMPLVFLAFKRYQESLFRKYAATDHNDIKTRAIFMRWMKYVCVVLPVVSRIVEFTEQDLKSRDASETSNNDINSEVNNTVENPIAAKLSQHSKTNKVESDASSTASSDKLAIVSSVNSVHSPTVLNPILVLTGMPTGDVNQTFIARRFSTLIVGDLAILLTFGTIFPPLAVVVFISIVSHTLLSQLVIGRFITLASVQAVFAPYVAVVKRETAAVGSLIALSIAPISVLATIFWSFFLFDILGDDAGTSRSYWILLVMPLLLLATRTGWFMYSSRSFHRWIRKLIGLEQRSMVIDSSMVDGDRSTVIELRPSIRPTESNLSMENRVHHNTMSVDGEVNNSYPAGIVHRESDADSHVSI